MTQRTIIRMLATAIMLATAGSIYAGGNEVLMERAAKRLLDMNKMVLEQLEKEDIPKDGRLEIRASVTLTENDPEIRISEITIISASDPEIILKRINLMAPHEIPTSAALPINRPFSSNTDTLPTKRGVENVNQAQKE